MGNLVREKGYTHRGKRRLQAEKKGGCLPREMAQLAVGLLPDFCARFLVVFRSALRAPVASAQECGPAGDCRGPGKPTGRRVQSAQFNSARAGAHKTRSCLFSRHITSLQAIVEVCAPLGSALSLALGSVVGSERPSATGTPNACSCTNNAVAGLPDASNKPPWPSLWP